MAKMGWLKSIEASLTRYRVMAYAVGVGLLVLVLIGVPLQVFAGNQSVVKIVGPVHGFLYIVYLLTAFDLAFRARFRPVRLFVMISAGLVPFVAFVIERRIERTFRGELAAALEVNAPVPEAEVVS